MRTLSFSLFFCYFSHILGHISGTTGPIGLKFFVRADFGHWVAHTKFQPLRLKDAKDIGCCAADVEMVLLTQIQCICGEEGGVKRNLEFTRSGILS